MDAVIRHVFSQVDPMIYYSDDRYAMLYAQAKWIWDHDTVASAAKGLMSLKGNG